MSSISFAELKRAVLDAIAAHDGLWYWYQLDRDLSPRFPQTSTLLTKAIKELEKDSLIRIEANGEHSDLQVYWITNLGRRHLTESST